MEFCMTESCGKCVPCRVGTAQMHDLLKKIIDRKATPPTWRCWKNFATWSRTPAFAAWARPRPTPCSARCGISATNTLAHINDKCCPAGRRRSRERRRVGMSASTAVFTLKIDGKDVSGRDDETILEVLQENKHRHSDALLPRRPLRLGRLPPLPGRDQGDQQASARLRHQGARAWTSRPIRRDCRNIGA